MTLECYKLRMYYLTHLYITKGEGDAAHADRMTNPVDMGLRSEAKYLHSAYYLGTLDGNRHICAEEAQAGRSRTTLPYILATNCPEKN
jgi:hypothetical protein